jgi:hypothetical protein
MTSKETKDNVITEYRNSIATNSSLVLVLLENTKARPANTLP